MANSTIIEAPCPFCMRLNALHVEAGAWNGLEIMYCDDPGDGGCGEPFAVRWSFSPRVSTGVVQFGNKKQDGQRYLVDRAYLSEVTPGGIVKTAGSPGKARLVTVQITDGDDHV